jgi:hypothetical protein
MWHNQFMASAMIMQPTTRGITTSLLHSTDGVQAVQAIQTSEYSMLCTIFLNIPAALMTLSLVISEIFTAGAF